MYCPKCKDEFRDGFTRCAGCEVDLVENRPGDESGSSAADAPPVPSALRLLDYCGFMNLDEARGDRDQLREAGIGTDIVIREAPESPPDGAIVEEYWLRVDVQQHTRAMNLLSHDASVEAREPAGKAVGDVDGEEEFDCGACGHSVGESETSCPKCGARFDDD
jgi:hypothetical protein